MKRCLLLLTAGLLAFASVAHAADETDNPAANIAREAQPAIEGMPLTAPEEDGDKLDALFAELKHEASPEAAAFIAAQIEAEWRDSGSATVDLLMLWSAEAMAKNDPAAAFDLLDQALVLKPDYAEAWNRRATLHFAESNIGKSLADIERTLALEPRHFGAWMGLGMILDQSGQEEKALEAYGQALEIYPAHRGAQDAFGRLSDELSGQSL